MTVPPKEPLKEEEFKIPWKSTSKKTEEDSTIGRLIQRFQGFIQRKPQVEIQLRERKIKELEVHADDIMQALMTAKQEMATNVDPDLYSQIETVIDPIIWEVRQLQRALDKSEMTLNKYYSWIQKATLWVNLCSRFTEKQAIKEALITHFTRESYQVIEGDIKVISDYLNDALGSIDINDHERRELEEGVGKEVAPFISALEELKAPPEKLTLEKVNTWRKRVDFQREKHFNNALHAIDEILEMMATKEISYQVPHLRSEVEALLHILQLEMEDEDRRIAFELHLSKLEKDLDRMDDEAHHRPESQDRLKKIRRQIDDLRNEIRS